MTFIVYACIHVYILHNRTVCMRLPSFHAIHDITISIYIYVYVHVYIYMDIVCICMPKHQIHVCMYALADNSSYWCHVYTCVQAYIQAHAYTFLQGNEPLPASRRDSIDSVSTVQSEQAQSLQRAGSKGLGSRRPSKASSSRRRALGGGSSKTCSKCASSWNVALELCI